MAKIPVSFRLEPPIERLLKEAVSRSGKKQSEYLEAMTIAHLTGDKLDCLRIQSRGRSITGRRTPRETDSPTI